MTQFSSICLVMQVCWQIWGIKLLSSVSLSMIRENKGRDNELQRWKRAKEEAFNVHRNI